jgi:hypothetical protein
MSVGGLALGTKRLLAVQIGVGLLFLFVVRNVVTRFVTDMPNIAAGTLPEDEFDHRYVQQPWLAYLHIVPGVVYLFLAPLQLAYRIRSRHYTFHRRLGRVVATAGMISGVFALIFGGLFSRYPKPRPTERRTFSMTAVTQPIRVAIAAALQTSPARRAGGRVKRRVGIAIALLLGGVTSLVVLWGIYQMLLLLVMVAVPTVLEVITGVD